MSALYADNAGKLLTWTQDASQDAIFGNPTGTTFTATFDPTTNPTLVTALTNNRASVALPANSAPQINGTPYTIIAGSQDYQTLALVKQAIAALKGTETLPSLATIQAALTAVQAGTATNAQAQLALAVTMRLLGLLAQRLLNNGTLG